MLPVSLFLGTRGRCHLRERDVLQVRLQPIHGIMKKNSSCFNVLILIALAVVLTCAGTVHASIVVDGIALQSFPADKDLEPFLDRVQSIVLDNGAINFTPYSLMLIQQSREAIKARNYDRAVVLAEYARKISPDLPPAYLAEAGAHFSRNKANAHLLFKGYFLAFVKKLQNVDSLSFFIISNASVIIGAVLLTMLVFALVVMLQYYRHLYHDVRHVIPTAVPHKAVWGCVMLLFLVPVFCSLSIFWVCLYWLVLLFGYMDIRKKCITLVLAGIIALVIPALIVLGSFCLYLPQSDLTKLLWKANYDFCDTNHIEQVETAALQNPDDVEVLFSIGLLQKKEQNFATAQKYYERLLPRDPRSYKTVTNLGNVYLALERWDDAVQKYKDAIALAPERAAAAHFNFARAYQQRFMFREAEPELVQAKKLDHARIDRYLAIYSKNLNRLLVDEVLYKKHIVARAYGLFQGEDTIAAGVWDLLFGGITLVYGPLLLILVSCLNVYVVRKEAFRISTKCTMCGKILCKRCQLVISADMLCAQCHNFLQKQEKLSYKQREAKVSQVARFVKRYRFFTALFSRLLPGAGHIWKGFPVQGVFFLLLFFLLLLKVVTLAVLDGPWDFILTWKGVEAGLCFVVFAVYWVYMLFDIRRVRSKEMEDNLALKRIIGDV